MSAKEAVGLIIRSISHRQHDGKPAIVLVATRSYNQKREDVWDALTNAERIPKWFLPITGDLRAGGNYQLKGNASGKIVVCEPPGRLKLTWGMQGQDSWVNLSLTAANGGGTELSLEHIAHIPQEMWEQYGPGATGIGWDLSMFGLEQHFAASPVVVPETADEWMASKEGKEFVLLSSDAWRQVSVQSGTGKEAAKAAAENVTRFYLGEDGG